MNYPDILERMLEASKLKNSSEIARMAGVTPQAMSNFRKKGELPAGFILKFADMFNVSVDWLITGTGEKFREKFKDHDLASKDLLSFNPDELIYIGKLLSILREPEKYAATIVKACIDATLSSGSKP
ncbi:MAG: helix-turn-helix domain-containing protein [Deltaproteobacteria bacterium]